MQRRYRLNRDQDFVRLRRAGRVFHHQWMRLSLSPNEFSYNRYGFITGKKLGNAVTRNRVRRLLRESMRGLHPSLQQGFDIVVVARKSIVGQPFDAIARIVTQLVMEAGILVEGS